MRKTFAYSRKKKLDNVQLWRIDVALTKLKDCCRGSQMRWNVQLLGAQERVPGLLCSGEKLQDCCADRWVLPADAEFSFRHWWDKSAAGLSDLRHMVRASSYNGLQFLEREIYIDIYVSQTADALLMYLQLLSVEWVIKSCLDKAL